MADDKEEVSAAIEIPTEFSLKEQLDEITSTFKSRKEFIETKIRLGKPIAPSRNLAMYSLARLEAIGRTIRKLYEEEKAAIERRRKMEEEGDDGF